MPGLPPTAKNSAEFDEFIRGLGLRYFEPYELRIHCEHPLNGLPPKDLWANIVPTIRLLDDWRSQIRLPIMLNSTYRSPEYNKHIGGAKASNHRAFCACDWWIRGTRMNAQIRNRFDALVRARLADGALDRAGRGYYSGSFIHIDTNHDNGARPKGVLATWTG